MMKPNYNQFFNRYITAYNEALKGNLDTGLIRSFFSQSFLAAGPEGSTTGKNDRKFSATLKRAYSFYRKIGTQKLAILRLDVTEIDDTHDMVKVFYRTSYESHSPINFDVTYLIEHHNHQAKIFAFIAGDEMKTYKEAGLI